MEMHLSQIHGQRKRYLIHILLYLFVWIHLYQWYRSVFLKDGFSAGQRRLISGIILADAILRQG